ncbi:L-ascorbate metabolism protein UlaG (beta-lactamase superfamily) [Herbinix hemicellulosilytica]|uniref:L-ascorbate metabolism protein UlaG (Beta-lactamase superfamily) n=1 Tax=Herbinix hemicellulosilytica TaxID=1564487 RepID=A0A0H5SF96_HERHM|nr:MBL fold metallo-hydrolase [Herbinix hemicellulosilytica]RBP57674.1 L-ascorbate metabolism protein UlaG (beta-lactamase superfamily) [Herbinix hemicellulosilytica]CRZ34157.1 hypothetical protein HHT355_0954 [Herbinix hemicellulosilytica]
MNINITYIGHSGFLAELNTCYFLFDYYKGTIPNLDPDKMLIVFVSHGHPDHFNPEIFGLYEKHPRIMYLISSDIKIDDRNMDKYGITDLYNKITIVNADSKYEISDGKCSMTVSTLKSTDEGVAFLIEYMDKIIYHAGDLNLWVWKEEDKQYNNNMKARFEKELLKIKGLNIDVAFAPLDPRQEEWYGLGLDALLDNVNIKYVFPMHFWSKPEVVTMYKKERESKPTTAVIMDVKKQGQSWSISI